MNGAVALNPAISPVADLRKCYWIEFDTVTTDWEITRCNGGPDPKPGSSTKHVRSACSGE